MSEKVKIIVHDGKQREINFQFRYGTLGKFCHQRPDRSFFLFGKQLPLCARCLGLYLSFLVGLIVGILEKSWLMTFRTSQVVVFLVVSVLPLLVDGFTQLYKLRESNNFLRLMTGLIAGFAVGISVIYAITLL